MCPVEWHLPNIWLLFLAQYLRSFYHFICFFKSLINIIFWYVLVFTEVLQDHAPVPCPQHHTQTSLHVNSKTSSTFFLDLHIDPDDPVIPRYSAVPVPLLSLLPPLFISQSSGLCFFQEQLSRFLLFKLLGQLFFQEDFELSFASCLSCMFQEDDPAFALHFCLPSGICLQSVICPHLKNLN